MAILLSTQKISKTFGLRPLFRDLSFGIEEGDRIGLIGPNGTGKSTLLKILAKQMEPDEGLMTYTKGVRVSYLPQVPTFPPQCTVLSALISGQFVDELKEEEWQREQRALEIFSKMNLSNAGIQLDSLVEKLSGGQKKRVAIGRALMNNPQLFLLDEPTNHLDIDSIMWLEDFLINQNFAFVAITHDRLFLQRIAGKIFELDRRNPQGLLQVQGDYAHYLETKESMMAAQESREIKLKNNMRRETEWLKRGAKARTTKQQARIERADDLKKEIAELEGLNTKRVLSLNFEANKRNPKKLLELVGVSKSYTSSSVLFENFELFLSPGMRLGIIGENGTGKSTLLKLIMKQENPTSGEVKWAENLKINYFEQGRDSLDQNVTPIQALDAHADQVIFNGEKIHVRGYLSRFLFRDEQMAMPIAKLSGGEQARLIIARLMLQDSNLLILDEPTNDLDLETLDVLQDALKSYNGAVILVTHDRYFLDQVSTQILAFPPKKLVSAKRHLQYFIGLSQWEEWFNREIELYEIEEQKKKMLESQTANNTQVKKRKLTFKEQKELDGMEALIQNKEARLEELNKLLLDPGIASSSIKVQEISRELGELEATITQLYDRWAELTS